MKNFRTDFIVKIGAFIGLLSLIFLSTACTVYIPGMHFNEKELIYPPETQIAPPIKIEAITTRLLRAQQAIDRRLTTDLPNTQHTVTNWNYRVGSNDVLSFIIWDHPELTIPAGEYRTADTTGHRISPDGTIFFPYIGKIHVSGLTLEEIRQKLSEALANHLRNPQIDVHVAAFRSQWIKVGGEIKKPGRIPITNVPMTIMEAIYESGGITEDADLTQVHLKRDGQTHILNAYTLQEDNYQEILLQNKDFIYIPDKLDNKIFVIGEVGQQNVHIMHKKRMSLADALGQSGGLDNVAADARRIYVIRSEDETLSPKVYLLDATSPDALLLSTRFQLNPLDVVYVESSLVTRWHRVISQILPTITGIKSLRN